ncbi:MAG: T9SS type A sorting domain-containing protein, partial [bacterium]
ESNGTPVANALVCISAKEDTTVYSIDTTDANGNAVLDLYPQIIEDTLYVTVTGENLQPYEGFMFTTVSGSFVGYYASAIDDTLGGNANGQINPGEVINLRLWIKNYGSKPALGVVGLLRTNDIYTTILDSLKSFGNIAFNQICSTGTDGYDFSPALNAPDGHIVNFDLICRDINDTIWVSHFGKGVNAAQLAYDGATVTGGTGNLEPGDTANVAVSLRNEGSASADSVTAVLRTLSSFINVIDSIGFYEHILPDSSASNNADPFIIAIDSNAPSDTTAQFFMILNSSYYVDTLSFFLRIGRKNFYIWNPDQTPEPGENMRDILTNLGYLGDYGTSLATDLGLYEVLFVCLGVYPNNYVINSSSPEAAALVDYLQNQNGRVYLEGGDVWYYDPPTGHDFAPLFGINPSGDGSSDMGPVIGETNTFTQSMNFNYGGENDWMDHIDPTGSGFLVFHDGDNNYNCGVANDAGNYRTVGTSFELGLLTDAAPPSTRAALLDSIMHFFGITTGIQDTIIQTPNISTTLEIYPNPCRGMICIKIQTQTGDRGNNAITIYDASGRSVRQYTDVADDQLITWSGQDEMGRDLPGGVYFVRLTSKEIKKTHKVVFLK